MNRSHLQIYDLDTDRVRTVFETDMLIEAPNWTCDNRLIVNGDGRIYAVPLDAPELVPIDTGFAQACNNDHGLSPDGKTLVISDKTRTPGNSCIYTLPVAGGTPRRITEHVPSWWHGWSPDGATIAYTAKREGRFDIYTQPAEGGEETRVTRDLGHCDGPDYTPDGAWIWFNADGTGHAQIWRVRPDGSDLEQMTDDARVNWFPHPSPDGAHVVYVSYPPGTEGHPRDLDVELRLMPAAGGAPRSLLKLLGGQGTINVPCWAPDGRAFAFMSYSAPGAET
ncbi:hypothetical protein R5H30_00510 [Sulfitobacter sp. D35]|uniref:TolB family protein n=1 Tax=Sulfitobacter sp. D35 TaxID=3083252 RepID=UPI00296E5DFC|nr:hypothetical protein [Sulfitobacter sp. D35]MDW4496445.1 hypothetical protein [Sulfitobacter sp. D35]